MHLAERGDERSSTLILRRWCSSPKICGGLMEEQIETEAPGSNRQVEIDESLRKLAQNLRKRRSRAKEKGDKPIEWETSFDLERLSKGGGLIDVHEFAPFVDCETLQEYLNTARKFAYAFR